MFNFNPRQMLQKTVTFNLRKLRPPPPPKKMCFKYSPSQSVATHAHCIIFDFNPRQTLNRQSHFTYANFPLMLCVYIRFL